jgi:hypothetical protein
MKKYDQETVIYEEIRHNEPSYMTISGQAIVLPSRNEVHKRIDCV